MPATIIIPGRLTKDAETRQAGQSQVVSFSVAVSTYENKQKGTRFYDVSWFGARAVSAAQYLRKGTAVCVTGEHSTREHNGKTYEQCRAESVTLLGGGGSRNQSSAPAEPQQTQGGGYSDAEYNPPSQDDDFPW